MKFKVDDINKISYFDYLTRNNASTMSLLRVWDVFLRNEGHKIPFNTTTLCIYSDSYFLMKKIICMCILWI